MKPPLRIMGLLTATALVASACSGGDAAAPTSVAPAPTETPTTTAAAPTTTTTSSTTTTTAAPTTTTETTDAVGDMKETHEAIVAQLELARQVSSIPEDAVAYLPDLSSPDPVVALHEAWKFENWLISVNPNPEWLRFYVLPNSPYDDEADSILSDWLRNNWRVEDFSDTYYFEEASVVAVADAEIAEDVRVDLPPGAVAILYVQGAGERTVLDRATGETVDTWAAYGPNTSLTVLTPTESGWRIVYSDSDYAA